MVCKGFVPAPRLCQRLCICALLLLIMLIVPLASWPAPGALGVDIQDDLIA
jgi:hypothetical protein